MAKLDHKQELDLWLRSEYGDMLVPEYRFHQPREGEKKRQWRFDFALPAIKVAIEFEGVVSHFAHTSVTNILNDTTKFNEAMLDGWLVVKCNTPNLRDGTAYDAITRAIQLRRGNAA